MAQNERLILKWEMIAYAGIRSTAGLGQTERRNVFTTSQVRQVFVLLFFCSKQQDSFEPNGLLKIKQQKVICSKMYVVHTL